MGMDRGGGVDEIIKKEKKTEDKKQLKNCLNNYKKGRRFYFFA